jgi:hypothetical protein
MFFGFVVPIDQGVVDGGDGGGGDGRYGVRGVDLRFRVPVLSSATNDAMLIGRFLLFLLLFFGFELLGLLMGGADERRWVVCRRRHTSAACCAVPEKTTGRNQGTGWWSWLGMWDFKYY